ncbi:hypothetical protein EDEG_03547 [Edhazardia aedis USNM 41457]|uniref:Uncharacterized protein n=1 Tax=Edhazardia aedis (strain USNM 41457) TaxID=1003232 RepID=J9DHC7_EDHAE|nr:hypothetical protein EDEG_03547 [Edhazardia aedis USNM 41457]|eukprot:EJW02005.1 hypothetical protein EDEG_03547 [Edhazardia aedis USNM 41457]
MKNCLLAFKHFFDDILVKFLRLINFLSFFMSRSTQTKQIDKISVEQKTNVAIEKHIAMDQVSVIFEKFRKKQINNTKNQNETYSTCNSVVKNANSSHHTPKNEKSKTFQAAQTCVCTDSRITDEGSQFTNTIDTVFLQKIRRYLEYDQNEWFLVHIIDDLYNELSKISDDYEEFILKGKLFKKLLQTSVIAELLNNEKSFASLKSESDDAMFFYNSCINSKLVYKRKNNLENKNLYKSNNCNLRSANTVEKNKKIKSTFYECNLDFIQNFNMIFKLFWRKFFYNLKESTIESDFQKQNNEFFQKNMDLALDSNTEKYEFENIFYLKLTGIPYYCDKRAHFRYKHMYKKRYQGFISARKYLKKYFNRDYRYLANEIQYEKMYRYDEKENLKLTKYGEEKLNKILRLANELVKKTISLRTFRNQQDIYDLINNFDSFSTKTSINTYKYDDTIVNANIAIVLHIWDFGFIKNKDLDADNKIHVDDIGIFVGLCSEN